MKGKEIMETQRDHHHQVIEMVDKPESGVESSIPEMQEPICNSRFIVIEQQLKEMRILDEPEIQKFDRYNFRGPVHTVHIYRAPESLKEMSCYAAKPVLVSIGPYHRTNQSPSVSKFENHAKLKFVDSLIGETEEEKRVALQRLFDAMKELEPKARDFYSERIEMSSDDFVQMMVIDGCFLVGLLQIYRRDCSEAELWVVGIQYKRYCQDHQNLGPFLVLTRDLLKLENQLPFFVLDRIFDLCIGEINGSRLEAMRLFRHHSLPWSMGPGSPEVEQNRLNRMASNHLLELFHSSHISPIYEPLVGPVQSQRTQMRVVIQEVGGKIRSHLFPWVVPSTPRSNTEEGYHPLSDQSMQCVTRLRQAGIRFRPRESADSFLQVQFHKGVLEIPPITLDHVTIASLINCVAWEHYRPETPRCFSAYVTFMTCLIKSDRDVTFLCDDGIITSYSHDDHQIAQTFKEFGDKVPNNIRECYLSKVFEEVEAYYGSHWATLRRTYFRSPWSFISLVTAALVVGFTAIQTIMAILSYLKPPHQ